MRKSLSLATLILLLRWRLPDLLLSEIRKKMRLMIIQVLQPASPLVRHQTLPVLY